MHAATLRSRHAKIAASHSREDARQQQHQSSSTSTSSAAASPSPSIAPPRPFPTSAPILTARIRLIGFALVILVILVLHQSALKRKASEPFEVEPGWIVGRLPRSYAICSPRKQSEVAAIWTVGGGTGEEREECMVVDGKEVVWTGRLEELRNIFGDRESVGPGRDPRVKELEKMGQDVKKNGIKVHWIPQGGAITPGLIDAHGHINLFGHWQSAVDLKGAESVTDVMHRMKRYLLANPDVEADKSVWLEGMGWDQNVWDVKAFPNADDLDAEPLLRDRPIVLTRIDSHATWVSNHVLTLLSPLPSTVEGGSISLDPSTNKPTGILIDNAMSLVDAVRPERTEAELGRWLRKCVRGAVEKGLVGVADAGTSFAELAFFEKSALANHLPLRIYSMLRCPDRSIYCGDTPNLTQIPWETYDGRLTLQSVKLVSDGALGSWGAAMLEPYSDRTHDGWKGMLLQPEESFGPLVKQWVDAGWQVNVHAIGDRANHVILNAFESAGIDNARRPRLEHAQILTQDDLKRLVDLDVIASYQPTHGTSDMSYAESKIGKERIKGAYAWQTVLSTGGRIALGSDFPIESIDPLKGFYSAVTRLDENGDSPHGKGGWYPDERLTRAQTLKGMTLDAAYASFMETITGSLVPGKRADYIVWNRDIMTCEPSEILEARVLMTVLDGQPVFGSLS